MHKFPIALAAISCLALAACGSAENAEAPTAEESPAMAAAPAEATSSVSAEAGVPTGAQGFVDAMAASDKFEIESSKLAEGKAKAPAIKAFAAMMVKDHSKSSADLKAAAAKATPAVTVTPQLTPQQQADLDRLGKAGDDFDALYAQLQVAGHEKALAALQAYSTGGDAPALKDFAGKTATVVSHHLDEAQKLAR